MPLFLKDGKLLRVGAKLAASVDCCCEPPCCPGETVAGFSLVLEDLDNAWGGLVDLGPHAIPILASDSWSGNVPYDTCDGTKYVTIGLVCDGSCGWSMTVGNPFNNQPWAGANGAGFTIGGAFSIDYTAGTWTIVFEFTKNVDADACGWGVGSAKNFRATFTGSI